MTKKIKEWIEKLEENSKQAIMFICGPREGTDVGSETGQKKRGSINEFR